MNGFIIDLDGTMYAGSRPIAGAAEFIGALRETGSPYVFATNNSSRTPGQVAEHLRQVTGIAAQAEDVLTTAQAAAMYVLQQGGGRRVCMIGETGLEHALRDAGLEVLEAGDGGDWSADYVVQGIDRAFDYGKLRQAVRLIRGGALSILTNPDHLLPGDDGPQPGAGSIGAAIERASGVAPVVIGKPSPILMGYAMRRLGLPADRIWVVGDNLRTDIAGGIASGCRTALVLTGLVSRDNVSEHIREAGGVQPELVADSLPDLWTMLRPSQS